MWGQDIWERNQNEKRLLPFAFAVMSISQAFLYKMESHHYFPNQTLALFPFDRLQQIQRSESCLDHNIQNCINSSQFSHWGMGSVLCKVTAIWPLMKRSAPIKKTVAKVKYTNGKIVTESLVSEKTISDLCLRRINFIHREGE